MKNTVRRHREKSLSVIVAFSCVMALALPPGLSASTVSFTAKPWEKENVVVWCDGSETQSFIPWRPDSVFPAVEGSFVTNQVVEGSEGQAPRVLREPTKTASSQDSDTSLGEAQIPSYSVNRGSQDSEFDADEVTTSWLGLSLTQDRRKLKMEGYAAGLLIVDVEAGSPAANAGLKPPIEGKVRSAAEIIALTGGIIFPPVLLGAAFISSTELDQTYDMIIGVDGDRITNIRNFEDHLRLVQPGEILYLSVVRDGLRRQIQVSIPPPRDARYSCGFLCFAPP